MSSEIPWTKAAGKLESARARWGGELGAAIRAMGPVLWPGVPGPVLQSFTMNGSQRENTGTARMPDGSLANPIFHEIGFFQTPAGPSSGPAPNPDPDAAHNAYGRIGRSAQVRAVLGGAGADLSPNAWRERVRDQTAIGVLDFKEEGARIVQALPQLAPSSDASPWRVALTIMGYVIGSGGATAALRPHVATLAAVPEAGRIDALMRVAAANPVRELAYPALRVWQRLEYARELARATGDAATLAWLPVIVPGPEREAIASTLVASYQRRNPAPLDATLPTYASAKGGAGVPTALVVAGAGAVALLAYALLTRSAQPEGRAARRGRG